MLKCLTWTIPINICPEYVTGTVFSHSSYGGGDICARPINMQIYPRQARFGTSQIRSTIPL